MHSADLAAIEIVHRLGILLKWLGQVENEIDEDACRRGHRYAITITGLAFDQIRPFYYSIIAQMGRGCMYRF
jgi:hypothetical protein